MDLAKLSLNTVAQTVSIMKLSTVGTKQDTNIIFEENQKNNVMEINVDDLPEDVVDQLNEMLDITNDDNVDNSNEVLDDKEEDKNIASMSEEEVQNMSTQELIDVFRSQLSDEMLSSDNSAFGDIIYNNQNSVLFDLVNKMTDEQLDEFMNTYKEMYSNTLDGNSLDPFSFESLEKGVMWGSYTVAAQKISQEEANSALERLKKYFPELIPNTGSEDDAILGVVQWV